MSTVPCSTPSCKSSRAWYAQLDGLSGILTRPAHDVLFLRDTGEVHALTEADYGHVTVLGEVAPSMQQYISDMAHGGAPGVCTSRQMLEV